MRQSREVKAVSGWEDKRAKGDRMIGWGPYVRSKLSGFPLLVYLPKPLTSSRFHLPWVGSALRADLAVSRVGT